jgi:hypothetical protein
MPEGRGAVSNWIEVDPAGILTKASASSPAGDRIMSSRVLECADIRTVNRFSVGFGKTCRSVFGLGVSRMPDVGVPSNAPIDGGSLNDTPA